MLERSVSTMQIKNEKKDFECSFIDLKSRWLQAGVPDLKTKNTSAILTLYTDQFQTLRLSGGILNKL